MTAWRALCSFKKWRSDAKYLCGKAEREPYRPQVEQEDHDTKVLEAVERAREAPEEV